MKKNNPKKTMPKICGKGILNEKHQIFEDKRTKRKRTRQARKDLAIKDQLQNTSK